jgi:hypothetical protein
MKKYESWKNYPKKSGFKNSYRNFSEIADYKFENYSHDPNKTDFMNTYDNLSPEAQNEVFTKAYWSGGDGTLKNPNELSDNTKYELDRIKQSQQKKLGIGDTKVDWSS